MGNIGEIPELEANYGKKSMFFVMTTKLLSTVKQRGQGFYVSFFFHHL